MRTKLEQKIFPLFQSMDSVDWENRETYGAFVAQTYYYVCHSTRLLAAAASRIPISEEKSYQRFVKHIAEENHHERLALNDVKALGYSISDFAELPATKSFYQSQYFYVDRVSPWALLGYILPLEVLASKKGETAYKTATSTHGKNTASFLKVHAAEDIAHVEQAFQLIESLPEAQLSAVYSSLETSCFLYGTILQTLPYSFVKKEKDHKNVA